MKYKYLDEDFVFECGPSVTDISLAILIGPDYQNRYLLKVYRDQWKDLIGYLSKLHETGDVFQVYDAVFHVVDTEYFVLTFLGGNSYILNPLQVMTIVNELSKMEIRELEKEINK